MPTALTPAVMHVLLALAGGELHGYGILKEVLRQTSDEVRLGPGTIYGTLQRLMESGLVEECGGSAAARKPGFAGTKTPGFAGTKDDPRRRYYRLTRSGREALEGEVDRLGALLRAARAHRILPRSSRG